jgi:hypothetical protein
MRANSASSGAASSPRAATTSGGKKATNTASTAAAAPVPPPPPAAAAAHHPPSAVAPTPTPAASFDAAAMFDATPTVTEESHERAHKDDYVVRRAAEALPKNEHAKYGKEVMTSSVLRYYA